MKLKKIASFFLIGTISVLTFTGCGDSKQDLSKKDSLVMTTGAVRTLDSVKASDSESFNMIQNTQETLLVYNHDKPYPGAAKSFDVSKDGLTYTFHLRDGLKWSDGKPLTSEDFKYSWMRLLNPDVGASYAFFLFPVVNAEKYYTGKGNAKDVGISTPDKNTLVVKLEHRVPYFDQVVAFSALSPQREDIVKKFGEEYGTKPEKLVYSGPYVVKEWKKGAKVELQKNPNYWNANEIKVPTIRLMEIKEFNTKYQMFANDQLDVIEGGTGDYINKLKEGEKEGKWKIDYSAMPSIFFTKYNVKSENKALANSKVRLALSLAVDRKGFTDMIIKTCIPAYGFVPPGILEGDLDYRKEVKEPLKEIKFKDPKDLLIEGLKEEGLDQDPSKYTFKYLLQGSTAGTKTQAEFMKDVWEKKLGIHVEIVPTADFSDYLQKENNGEYDLAFSGWSGDYNSPLTFLDLFMKGNGSNTGGYNNEKVNELLKKLDDEGDPKKRIEICKQIELEEIVKDPAMAPIYYEDKNSFQKNYVEGLQFTKFGGRYQLRFVSIKK